jgi:hypothetical protein
VLRPDGDASGQNRQDEQRNLFEEYVARMGPQSTQRPHIKEQQHDRKRQDHRLRKQTDDEQTDDGQIPAPGRLRRVFRIREDCEHPEHGAQDVFAFGDPGNRLDAQRMNREHGRHEGRAGVRAGHPHHQPVEQQRGQDVQHDVDEMV